jgi:hypothetical protein
MISVPSKTVFFIVTIIISIAVLEGAGAEMAETTVDLPKTLDLWTRSDSVQIVNANTIFDYMNGGGELYLAYRFDHLEVYEYTAEQQDDILVEVYLMNSSDDAFGLLSLDWDGEAVQFSSSSIRQTDPLIAPPIRALYGGGLLRLWADTIYARVLAYRETPEARAAVLALGRAIAANRKSPAEPAWLQVLPQTIGTKWKLRRDRIGYFRSHLVFNSLYYLSHQNLLNLDLSTEAVTAPYESVTEPSTRIQVLFVKYATPEQTRQALDHFHTVYLSEYRKGFDADTTKHSNLFNIEDGWLGYRLNETCLAVVFECPDRESAQMIMGHISCNAINKEEDHAK